MKQLQKKVKIENCAMNLQFDERDGEGCDYNATNKWWVWWVMAAVLTRRRGGWLIAMKDVNGSVEGLVVMVDEGG
ncbi:unnamed protein product [Lactuca virosa]|uniref:Uncharacterized protein n=1 Tax=Lactuca virosa TaxID=75947 RepID=A0AAU9LGA5_9ASTR|nr:unnamed protein product [Lactuca virosa]